MEPDPLFSRKTTVHDLPTDIWFEIFAYFYVDELFHSFVKINHNIDLVLFTDTQLRFHARFDDQFSTRILSQIRPSQIVSLDIVELDEDDEIDIHRMDNLHSVSLKGTNMNSWMERSLTRMLFLTELKRLRVTLAYDTSGPYLVDLALRIPRLQYLFFHDVTSEFNFDQIQMANLPQSSIEQFILNSFCQNQYLDRILSRLPNTRMIRLKLLRGNDELNMNNPNFRLVHLEIFHLTLCDMSFDAVLSLVHTMPNIKTLIIDGNVWGTNSIDYFQTKQWQQLLKWMISNIERKKIVVDLDLRQDFSNLSTDNIGVIDYDYFEKIELQVTKCTIKGVVRLDRIDI